MRLRRRRAEDRRTRKCSDRGRTPQPWSAACRRRGSVRRERQCFSPGDTLSRTAASSLGPTTSAEESCVLHEVQTLMTQRASAVSEGAKRIRCRDRVVHPPLLTWPARGRASFGGCSHRHMTRRSSPARCTPPRRLQSTRFDGRSPGLRVKAARAFPDFPVAEARARRLQLRGQLRIWDRSRHRIPFSPPTAGGPSLLTVSAGPGRVNGRPLFRHPAVDLVRNVRH